MKENKVNRLKIALPKGHLLAETAGLLKKAGWGLKGYTGGTRSYRVGAERFPYLLAKIFNERDIPVQVAVGNYDLGICGLDWIEELLVKYPSSALVKVRDLGYGEGILYAVTSNSRGAHSIEQIGASREVIRLASEYPNLAESFALKNRLRRFSIFPLWGAAEAYPPENAELVLIAGMKGQETFNNNLVPISDVLKFGACIIANKRSWEKEDLSEILASLEDYLPVVNEKQSSAIETRTESIKVQLLPRQEDENTIRMALPDGHQQKHAVELLMKAGIQVHDYPSETANRRPSSNLEGVALKVIRPQDMPSQVATGSFDLAITGKDWLFEHLYQFPSSPIMELLDLKFARVKIVAVVSNDLAVSNMQELGALYASHSLPVRMASEYVNIADKCARDNHLGMYRVIPTWGATEAFLPEDADLLIENTETGRTIARHNLRIIDTLFISTGCLIGNRDSVSGSGKAERIKSITAMLKKTLER